MLGLFSPAFALIAILVVLPVGWLFYLSFIDGSHFSTVHYGRMIEYTSYYKILLTTLRISAIVTVCCVVTGYPVAYLLSQLAPPWSTFCMTLIIIPFWTSLLVRTYAWLVLLSPNGPINALLLSTGLIANPLDLVFNETGTVIGMVHVMLPFFVLPLYSVIKSFDWTLIQAASSLGAPPPSAFGRVFVPLSLPGLVAGAVLVFVQSLGFFVTPAVLGGGKVTMVSMKIAGNVQNYFEWGASSAFGMVLLVSALGVLALTARLLGFERTFGVAR
jgi:putative spermidine/putrescine transport system permease protein/spermidine/putrescine transport system permease protein